MDRKPYIGISWIQSYMYCPYQFYLSHVEKVRVPKTKDMVMGSIIHKQLQIEHEKMAEEVLSIEEAMVRAPLENVTFVFREVKINALLCYAYLNGYIDEVQVAPDRIFIIDDKPGNAAYVANKYQVWGYAITFSKKYAPKVPIYGALRNRDTQKIIWSDRFTDRIENEIASILKTMADIKERRVIPDKTDNINKCRSCRFRPICEKGSGGDWNE